MRVLIVDDSRTMREIERGILEAQGYPDVEEASGADAALESVRRASPDLLIVDWDMPGIDGMEFVRRYREDGGASPVLMVSAARERERIVEAVRAGASGMLLKPFTPDLFAQRVREVAAGRQAD